MQQQVPGLVPDASAATIEQTVRSAFEYQAESFDQTRSLADRHAAEQQVRLHAQAMTDWLGDPQTAGTAIRVLSQLDFNNNRLASQKRARQMGPEELAAHNAAQYPALTAWQKRNIEADATQIGSSRDRAGWTVPSAEVLQEMFWAGDSRVSDYADVRGMIDPLTGGLTAKVTRKSALQSLGAKVGIGADDFTLDDEIAEMPNDFNNPAKVMERRRNVLLLYGQQQERPDGSRYVYRADTSDLPYGHEGYNLDGSDPSLEVPNIDSRRMLTVPDLDGKPHTFKVTDELITEVIKAREGGFAKGRIAEGLENWWVGTVPSYYGGEMLQPNITGNPELDAQLAMQPRWQRAMADVPREGAPGMRMFDFAKTVYFMTEFGLSMAATRGLAGGLAKAGGAIAETSGAAFAARIPGIPMVTRGVKTVGTALIGGERRLHAQTSAVYTDSRVVGQFIGYESLAGMANGEWRPTDWAQQGWNDGVAMFMFGAAARAGRGLTMMALDGLMPSAGRYASWRMSLAPRGDDVASATAKTMLEQGSKASTKAVLEGMAKRGMLNAQSPGIQAELVGQAFDSMMVGLGMSALASAQHRALQEKRDTVGVGDFIAALGSSEAWMGALGMLTGHMLNVLPGTARNRRHADAVPVFGGALGVRLDGHAINEINDHGQVLAHSTFELLQNPAMAEAFMRVAERQANTSAGFHQATLDRMAEVMPDAMTPPVAGGHTRTQLVDWIKKDPDTLQDALRYASEQELEIVDATITNWRWDAGAKPDQDALDTHARLRGVVEAELVRRANPDELSAGQLTGQKPAERTRQAIQNLGDALTRERQQRYIVDQWRRVRRDLMINLRLHGGMTRKRAEMAEAEKAAIERREAHLMRSMERFDAMAAEEWNALDDLNTPVVRTDGVDWTAFEARFQARENQIRAEEIAAGVRQSELREGGIFQRGFSPEAVRREEEHARKKPLTPVEQQVMDELRREQMERDMEFDRERQRAISAQGSARIRAYWEEYHARDAEASERLEREKAEYKLRLADREAEHQRQLEADLAEVERLVAENRARLEATKAHEAKFLASKAEREAAAAATKKAKEDAKRLEEYQRGVARQNEANRKRELKDMERRERNAQERTRKEEEEGRKAARARLDAERAGKIAKAEPKPVEDVPAELRTEPLTTARLQDAVVEMVRGAETDPEFAHKAGHTQELVDEILEGRDTSSPRAILDGAAEMTARADAIRASVKQGVKLTRAEKEKARPVPVDPEQAQRYWATKEREESMRAGSQVLHPQLGGTADQALELGMHVGFNGSLLAEYGVTPVERARGRAIQESLAVGLLTGAGLDAKVDDLAVAVSGLPIERVVELRTLLREGEFSHLDAGITEALLATERELTGVPVLTADQLAGKGQRTGLGARQLLRLIALGPPIMDRTSDAPILRTGRAARIKRIRERLAASVESLSSSELLRTGSIASGEQVAAHVQGATARLEYALERIPRAGLRFESPMTLLLKKIAQALTGDANKTAGNTFGPGATTIGDVAAHLVERLSKGSVEVLAKKREAARPVARGLTGEALVSGPPRTLQGGSGASDSLLGLEARARGDSLPVMASRWVTMSGLHTRLVSQLRLMALEVSPGVKLVHEDASPAERAFARDRLLRGVLDDAPEHLELLKANGMTDAQILTLKSDAEYMLDLGQEVMRGQVKEFGLGRGTRRGEAAVEEFDHLLGAIQDGLRGQPATGERKRVLLESGWLDADGFVIRSVAKDLTEITMRAHETALTALDGEFTASQLDLKDTLDVSVQALRKLRGTDYNMLYAMGMSPATVREIMRAGLDGISGYYDRLWTHPRRSEYERFSAQPLIGWISNVTRLNRAVDFLIKLDKTAHRRIGDGLGPIAKRTIAQRMLRAWTASLASKSRGLAAESVRKGNAGEIRASARGLADMNHVMRQGSLLLKHLMDANLSMPEREFISKAVDAGVVKDILRAADKYKIPASEAWTRLYGPDKAWLFPHFLELNEFYNRMGEIAVESGLLTPEQRMTMKDQYVTMRYLRVVYRLDGTPAGYAREGTGSNPKDDGLAGLEHLRRGEIEAADIRRLWDPMYLVPRYSVEMSQRVRVFNTAMRLIDEGVPISREQYMRMPAWERSQYERWASAGRNELNANGKPEAIGLSEQEFQELLRRGFDPVEELRERNDANIYQIMTNRLIERERLGHDGPGLPRMSERMRKTLEEIEYSYVPLNTLREFSMMVDATDLSKATEGPNPILEHIDRVSQAWRQMRTVYNPRHWVLQLSSNWFSNAMLGKVPLHDVFDRNGATQTGLAAINKWIIAEEGGYADLASHPDRDVRHVHRMMERAGANSLAGTIGPPRGIDYLGTFLGGAAQGPGLTLSRVSSTLSSEFAQKALDAGPSLSKLRTLVDKLSNASSPEARQEAELQLVGLYKFLDLGFKYAAQISGERMGMSEAEAWHWGTEGTGDFSDVNPTIRMFSSQTRMGGALFNSAKARMTQRDRILLNLRDLGQQGVGGPFWMYTATMNNAAMRGMVNHPLKTAFGLAAFTGMVQLMSSFAGDDTDLLAIDAGRNGYLHANSAAFERLVEADPDAMVRIGPIELAAKHWLLYWNAYVNNVLHAASFGALGEERPESEALFRMKGPKLGGNSTEIDFSSFAVGPQNLQYVANLMHMGGDPRGFEAAQGFMAENRMGFLGTVAWSTIALVSETTHGVKGKEFGSLLEEHILKIAQAWATPLARLPWFLSREGMIAIGETTFGGQSLRDAWNDLPSERLVDSPERSFAGILGRTLLPMREMQRTAVTPHEGILNLFGRGPRDPTPADAIDAQSAIHSLWARTAILNVVKRRYREMYKHGGPAEAWYTQALDLGEDLQVVEDEEALYSPSGSKRRLPDLVDHPRTALGKAIHQASDTIEGRRLLVRSMIENLQDSAPHLLGMIEDPRGLLSKRRLPPEIADRMFDAAYRGPVGLSDLIKTYWDNTVSRTANPDHAAVFVNQWLYMDMDNKTASVKKGDAARVLEIQRWVAKQQMHVGAMPADVADATFLRAVGPSSVDRMPMQSNAFGPGSGELPSFMRNPKEN